jgi:hypothetical protein
VPLYQRLASRGNVEVNIQFLSDVGYRPAIDRGSGVPVTSNIYPLARYDNDLLIPGKMAGGRHLVRRSGTHKRANCGNRRPTSRVTLKELIPPAAPAKSVPVFLYIHIVRCSYLDGKAGFHFTSIMPGTSS